VIRPEIRRRRRRLRGGGHLLPYVVQIAVGPTSRRPGRRPSSAGCRVTVADLFYAVSRRRHAQVACRRRRCLSGTCPGAAALHRDGDPRGAPPRVSLLMRTRPALRFGRDGAMVIAVQTAGEPPTRYRRAERGYLLILGAPFSASPRPGAFRRASWPWSSPSWPRTTR
jgi:hypothetical protein